MTNCGKALGSKEKWKNTVQHRGLQHRLEGAQNPDSKERARNTPRDQTSVVTKQDYKEARRFRNEILNAYVPR